MNKIKKSKRFMDVSHAHVYLYKIIIILIIAIIIFMMMNKTEKNKTTISGTATKSYALERTENVEIETDARGNNVPVPIGYVGSKATGENAINTGYVIYEGEEEVNNTNLEEAKRTRNQYVWIPVQDVNELCGVDKDGKLWGKERYLSYKLWTLNWSESNGIMTILNEKGNKEPYITSDDRDSNIRSKGLGLKTSHEFLMKLESEFNDMIESAKKYGGFYVGRYEVGNLSQDIPIVRKGNTDIGNQTWYTMYKKCKKVKGNNECIETEMLWGCQFDRILTWLIETKNKKLEEIVDDSRSWANYNQNSITYIDNNGVEQVTPKDVSVKIPTGSSEQTKTNNIYDLAGNATEYIKKSDVNSRSSMGGAYALMSTSGILQAALDYSFSPNESRGYLGCRVALVIK